MATLLLQTIYAAPKAAVSPALLSQLIIIPSLFPV